MNRILLCLLTFILIVPAWAEETAVELSTHKSAAKKVAPAAPTATAGAKAATTSDTTTSCPTGCLMMACPPPSGPLACCHKTSSGFAPC
jgi:hypothetical protein